MVHEHSIPICHILLNTQCCTAVPEEQATIAYVIC
jgi:hypothetical protein